MGEAASLLSKNSSVLGKSWIFRQTDPRDCRLLTQHLGVSDLIARLLNARGITAEQASDFLSPTLRSYLPDPSHLKDMDIGVNRVIQALRNKEKIAIFGDYDVDGATSSALLYRFFEHLGAPLRVYIPDRQKEGYGPTVSALRQLHEEGMRVVITVDCGTTAHESLEQATELGLDSIVIDHHVSLPFLPKVTAVINPNRVDQESSCGTLAAVGVSFLFLVALNRALKEQNLYTKETQSFDLLSLLDLVALGTVCDVVSLTGLNRAFVSQGLKIMGQRKNLGLKTLMDQSGIQSRLTPYHLGFILGPRVNAGGRVGQSSLGVQLLTTREASHAQTLAQSLSTYNDQRQAIETQVLEEATAQVNPSDTGFICVFGEGWHPGVIGIVAGRLKDKFHRPCAVIALDGTQGKASARSIAGFDLGAQIQEACRQGLLITGGGHPMAAGFTIDTSQIKAFQAFMNDRLQGVDMTPYLYIDSYLSANGVTVEFIQSLEKMEPFGMGNSTPRFVLSDARLNHIVPVGTHHLRCSLRTLEGKSLTAMAFRSIGTSLGDALLNSQGQMIEVAGTVSLNTWGGRDIPQFIIEDMANQHR